MNGFFNRLLRIDLNQGEYLYEDIPDSLLEKTLGGKGFGTHYLLIENPPNVDPLAPENIFIIATGPVTGTRLWGQSRFAAFSKSPATGGYGESYCGGTLAAKIKGCGVDVIIIQGRRPRLTYLSIGEDGVSFHDATELKGKDTFSSEQYIIEHSAPGASAMVIGPAGENRVAFACIKADRWRSLGRGGLGAVLGAKNLKGISFSGSKKAVIADTDLLENLVRKLSQIGRNSPVAKVYQQFGTPSQVQVTNTQECFPTRYWQSGRFENWQKLSAEYMHQHFHVRRHGCPSCFLQCTKTVTIKEGRHRGLQLDGPEYETIYALGGLNGIDSLEEVSYLNVLCDRLGLDTISAGNIVALVTEAASQGRLDFPIEYNHPDKIAELIELISRREEFGAVLAHGIRFAAQELDLEDLAIHVKGLEPAGFDPRVLKGMGLSYATAARGACHLRGTFYKAELSGQIDKNQIAGKAELVVDYEDRAALFDSLILCRFFRDFILWDEISTAISASTGLSMSKQELEQLANRIIQQSRAYNHREGLNQESDNLPVRFFREKTAEGAQLSESDLNTMISEYNSIRGEIDEYNNPRT